MTDDELDKALDSWHLHLASSELESRTLTRYQKEFHKSYGLKGWLTRKIYVPIPLAATIILAMLAVSIGFVVALHHARINRAPSVVIKTQTIEIPKIQERVVVQTVYQRQKPTTNRAKRALASAFQPDDFVPVSTFAPRIVRSGHAQKN